MLLVQWLKLSVSNFSVLNRFTCIWVGTLSNETAGHRACKCLRGFYRMDRFGPCSECPAHGLKCVNDTAILAPNYYWKWPSEKEKRFYRNFLENIYTLEPPYDKRFSSFQGTLPQPQKCPYPRSCNGGVDSSCQDRFKGILCASCSINHYLRFNTCLECPRMVNTIISWVVVVLVFVAVFLVVLWGDSKRVDNNRTVADVVMSCCKIVIGFYQVIAGIFSALVHVRWPVILISMEKYLKFTEGNILQFAPLSCIHSKFRPDPFLQFALAVGLNILVVLLIFLFLFLKKRHINKMEVVMSEKIIQISRVKKSCYRNIFLFLLLSYPVTSKKIIDILPLPGVCVNVCFSKSDCISLLKADYSIHCFTPRHKIFWKIAAVFAFYPIAFPLMLLLPIYKYRQAETEKEIAFGLRVFFENYKEKYWFWETLEMYRKLLLISLILLFGSESHSQIGFTLVITSASGIAYTLFRPIKGKFEDRLQTFVLWITFFNVCLGSLYGQSDGRKKHVENDSIFINVLFLLLNSSVLIVAAGEFCLSETP